MSANNSQIGLTPSESVSSNNGSQETIRQLISNDIITTDQPFVEVAARNMIPSQTPVIPQVQDDIVLTRRHEGRRRRRQRQRQRRRERFQELRQPYHPLPRPRQRQRHDYVAFARYPSWEPMDSGNEWNQQQIYELEGFAALEQLQLIQDDLEQQQQIEYVEQMLEEDKTARNTHIQSQLRYYEAMIEDNLEQLRQIEHVYEILDEQDLPRNHHVRRGQPAQQHRRNEEELIQREQWENVAFLIQQMNQN